MLAPLILMVLAAGPAVAAPSGLKDPFTTAQDSGSDLKDPWAEPPQRRPSTLGLQDPFTTRDGAEAQAAPTREGAGAQSSAPSDLHDPFTTRAPAGTRTQELKDPWAQPARQRTRRAQPAEPASDLLDPFSAPRPAASGLRDPWAKRPVVQRPQRPRTTE